MLVHLALTLHIAFPLLLPALVAPEPLSSYPSHSPALARPQQCVDRPADCLLSCPGGYASTLGADHQFRCQCLCQQQKPVVPSTGGCQTESLTSCRPGERCVSVNGQPGCVPVFAAGLLAQPVVSSRHENSHLVARPLTLGRPIEPTNQRDSESGGVLLGECPPLVSGNCEVQCHSDEDCGGKGRGKCCPNGCGRQCVEALLSSVPLRPNLAIRPLRAKTDGDACENVRCENPIYRCQLVESDCAEQPCAPVPRCEPVPKLPEKGHCTGLLNPCPTGSPMRLPSGVTALCREESQCRDKYWCHQIGYNGLGFCCPTPKRLAKAGSCPAKKTMAWERDNSDKCAAECRSDTDCGSSSKCCFDGCGLSCRSTDEHHQQKHQHPVTVDQFDEAAVERPASAVGRKKSARPIVPLESSDPEPTVLVNPPNGREKETYSEAEAHLGSGEKPGRCPKWPAEFCKFSARNGKESENECENDAQCEGVRKCCPNPCAPRQSQCQFVNEGSECLLQRGAAQKLAEMSNGVFEPKCGETGQFMPVQSHKGHKWCVDSRGREVPGTRQPEEEFVDCEPRKQCPSAQCSLKCPFGLQLDEEGCEKCTCRESPCRQWSVQCPESTVCRLVPKQCQMGPALRESSCHVPQCEFRGTRNKIDGLLLGIPNTCLRGEPLESAVSGELVQCDEQRDRKCPPGWYCQQLGIDRGGYCCQGLVLQSELLASATKCPALPSLSAPPLSSREDSAELECRLSSECPSGHTCCFNGVGTECVALGEGTSGADERSGGGNERNEQHPQEDGAVPQPAAPSQQRDQWCPAWSVNVSNPGCASNCANDAECALRSPHMHCCPFGCGQQCQFSERLTPCVHRLAATLREVDKMAAQPQSVARPTEQCTLEGLFQAVQVDALRGQYWCVDPLTGVEMVGTRRSGSPISPNAAPDCNARHFCKHSCPREASERCEHGLRLDHRGCPPAEEACKCRDACEDFKCSLSKEICVLRRVKCADGGPCPRVPTCVDNVCRRHRLELTHRGTCTGQADCGEENECKLAGTGDRLGLCCGEAAHSVLKEQPISQESSTFASPSLVAMRKLGDREESRQGLCPVAAKTSTQNGRVCSDECHSDSDCAGIQKCCPAEGANCRRCVQPILATNCQNLLSAVGALDSGRVQHFIPQPTCLAKKGEVFSRVQCDDQGWCWCVLPLSGVPVQGTRKFQPTSGEEFCSEAKECPIQCPARQSLQCPFGVESDLDGCPLSSECRCRSPCAQVRCPHFQTCQMRPRDCAEAQQESGTCIPVPVCAHSPCGGTLHPALDPRLLLPLRCLLGAEAAPSSACPPSHQCVWPVDGGMRRPAEERAQLGICCPRGDGERNEEIADLGGAYKVCAMEMDQGSGIEACGIGRTEVRYFYDSQEGKCKEFLFSGCGGNGNNFAGQKECEAHCVRGREMEQFQVGLVLEKLPPGEDLQLLDSALRSHLGKAFALQQGQIHGVSVAGDGQIQFGIVAPDARQKAKSISDALALGQFRFRSDGHVLRAKSDGWWARREPLAQAERGAVESRSALFWVILFASLAFALVVLLIPCCAFIYLLTHPRHSAAPNGRASRETADEDTFASPSPRVQALIQHSWSPLPTTQRKTLNSSPPLPLNVLVEEEEHRRAQRHTMRSTTRQIGGPHPQQVIMAPRIMSDPAQQKGLRASDSERANSAVWHWRN